MELDRQPFPENYGDDAIEAQRELLRAVAKQLLGADASAMETERE